MLARDSDFSWLIKVRKSVMNVLNSTGIDENRRVTHSEIYKVCEAGYNEVAGAIVRRGALNELEKFGGVISARPLKHEELAIFFRDDLGLFQGCPLRDSCISCSCN